MSADPFRPPSANLDTKHVRAPSKYFLVRCWLGEARLWQAFWVVLVLGYVVLNLLVFAFLFPLGKDKIGLYFIMAFNAAANLALFTFGLVSTWRCAPNASRKAFGVMARVAAVLITVAVFVSAAIAVEQAMRAFS